MPLSDLQVRLTQLLQTIPGADEFVLAGGGAMAVLGIGDRGTNDLDWFAQRADVVEAFAPRLITACQGAGFAVEQLIADPGFRRFEVRHGSDATLVDIAWDARLRAPRPSPYGPVLDRDELAADKVLALFGRAAPRDFVDVYRLLEYYSRDALCALAAEKDRGFEPQVLGEMLTRIGSYERHDFPVDDETFDAMRREFEAWQRVLGCEPNPNPTPRSLDFTRAPEPPGLDLD